MSQTEIKEPFPALDDKGRPQNFGWARSPVWAYNSSLLNAPRRKVSEGDSYILFSPRHAVLFEILDDGYMGYLFMSVVSLKDKKCSSETFIKPFSMGYFDLPGDSDSSSIKFRHKKNLVNFACMEKGVRIIKIDVPNFGPRHESLMGQVVLSPPENAESLVTHLPWKGRGGAFSYSRRSPCYYAEGVIQFGLAELVFTRGEGWGIFDWNRVLRPRSDLRFWAAGCGKAGEHQAGFSVGYNSTDSSFGTENAFFLDGKLHKLDQVTFHIPPTNWLSPWRFTSNDTRLEMIFTPQQERTDRRQVLLHSVTRRQVYGTFSGKAILDDGSEVDFENITGFAERCKTRF